MFNINNLTLLYISDSVVVYKFHSNIQIGHCKLIITAMASPKKTVIDPDYELTEVAREHVKIKESAETKDTLEKIINIINREFKTELDHRQSQLDLIQQRLNKAQKTLHLLKYILINNYYNGKNMFIEEDEELINKDELQFYNKNGLHPAVKKLIIGNNLADYNLNLNKSPRKKMKYFENQTNINNTTEQNSAESKYEVFDLIKDTSEKDPFVHKSDDNVKSPLKEECDTTRNRKKEKYRIVVGNISKWMPSGSEEDKSTHKWMVYVRGSKEKPDVSDFVEKVVFYLHPSYEPNDVVELRHPPFHLSRRGWGEFPVRVKIFFKYTLNKPVDIIHNLKLDQTFSGQQTLGNETIANLFLYKNEKINALKEHKKNENYPAYVKEEFDEDFHDEDIPNTNLRTEHLRNEMTVPSEHDYCTAPSKKESTSLENSPLSYDLYMEHSYARTHDSKVSDSNSAQSTYLVNISDLIKENTSAESGKVNSDDGFKKLYVTNNSTVIAIKKLTKPQESLLKKDFKNVSSDKQCNYVQQLSSGTGCNSINYQKYDIHFPKNKFKNCDQALPYLFKKMPLITELALNLDYKCTYPFAAKSLQEYSNWNIGRRLSSEWYQAKMIQTIMNDAKVKGFEKLTPKSIIMYGRSHGYTPLANYEIFRNKSKPTLDDTVENLESEVNTRMSIAESMDEVVDIINCHTDKNKTNHSTFKIKIVDKKLELACSYIKQVALDGGVILRPQEIIPDVIFNEAERMLLKALLCLAEDIIRSAKANLVYRGNFDESTSPIDVGDICEVICERPRFKFLLKLLPSCVE